MFYNNYLYYFRRKEGPKETILLLAHQVYPREPHQHLVVARGQMYLLVAHQVNPKEPHQDPVVAKEQMFVLPLHHQHPRVRQQDLV